MAGPEELRKRASDYRDEAARLQTKAANLESEAGKQDAQDAGSTQAPSNPFL